MAGTGQLIYAGDFIDKKEFFFFAQGWKNTANTNDLLGFKRLTATGPTFSTYASFNGNDTIPSHVQNNNDNQYNITGVPVITFIRDCILDITCVVKAASDTEYRINLNLWIYRNGSTIQLMGCDDNAEVAPARYANGIFQFLTGDKLYGTQWNKSNAQIEGVRTTVAFIING